MQSVRLVQLKIPRREKRGKTNVTLRCVSAGMLQSALSVLENSHLSAALELVPISQVTNLVGSVTFFQEGLWRARLEICQIWPSTLATEKKSSLLWAHPSDGRQLSSIL